MEEVIAIKPRTKIVATIGPATDTLQSIESLLLSGVNVARINFSHGSHSDHRRRVGYIREVSNKHQLAVAILGDLQGPKIRIARFKNDKVKLSLGQTFILDMNLPTLEGDEYRVGVDFPALVESIKAGDILLLDDGRIRLKVTAIKGSEIHTSVIMHGVLQNNKGINKMGGGLSAPALTEKDKRDIPVISELHMEYAAVSFPCSAHDMIEAKELLKAAGSSALVIAKIERAEVVEDESLMDEIIEASDAIMVARGDLGVEIGEAGLIGVQKKLIKRSLQLNRPVITATQMMESMIEKSMPTRAEVFDVANAILDGTDAVMLSAETASGLYPDKVVSTVREICLGAEKHDSLSQVIPLDEMTDHVISLDNAIAKAAVKTARIMPDIKAIICLTESGNTALWASRLNTHIRIFALTPHVATFNRVSLFKGVQPIMFDPNEFPAGSVSRHALSLLKELNLISKGEKLILTMGDNMSIQGSTNTLKILQA